MRLFLTIREEVNTGATRIVLATEDTDIIDSVRRAINDRLVVRKPKRRLNGHDKEAGIEHV